MTFDKEKILKTCEKIKQNWLKSEQGFPEFLEEIKKEEKLKNEAFILSAGDTIKKQLNSCPLLPGCSLKWKQQTEELFQKLLKEEPVLGISAFMQDSVIENFQNEMKHFLKMARNFDPDMDFNELGQALRNYLVYAVFMELNGLEQFCSPAIFGYSMLYPYTDNYIDAAEHTKSEKKAYNQLIYHKLSGLPVQPETKEQAQAEKMLDSILSFYKKEQAEDICQGLLFMLKAQQDSLKQQKTAVCLTEQEILDISVYKGGLSVLIDRYYVPKEITENDLVFYMSYGFFLQLADDLQDIAEDSQHHSQTLLSCRTEQKELEKIVNQMLHFLKHLFDDYPVFNQAFYQFLFQNCCQLVFASVERSKSYFSEAYLKKVETCFPVHFSVIEKWTGKGTLRNPEKKYMRLLDEFL